MEAFVIASTMLAVALGVLWVVRWWQTRDIAAADGADQLIRRPVVDEPDDAAALADVTPVADPAVVVSISVPSSRRSTLVRTLLDAGLALDAPDADGPADVPADPGAAGTLRRRKVRLHTEDGPGALDIVLGALDGMGFRIDHADARDIVLRGWDVGEARVAVRSIDDAEAGALV